MSIIEFLEKPKNTHAREKIINYKLFYDLSLAAATKGYELQIYTPETDHEGVDVIFDDSKTFQKVQLKTVLEQASTKSWDIHNRLLRPELINVPKFGFHPGGPNGLEGGVILIVIRPDNMLLELDYYYTDIHILSLFLLGILPIKGKNVTKLAEKVFKELHERTNSAITLTKSLFIKSKDPDSLLVLLGLVSKSNGNAIRFHAKEVSSNYWQPHNKKEVISNNSLKELLSKLADDTIS